MKINDTQLYIQPIHEHIADCLAASRNNIGNISVQNATDVTFGHKTLFNAPVMIKQLVVDYTDPHNDKNNMEPVKTKGTLCTATTRHFFHNYPCMICAIFSALAMILVTVILLGFFFLEPTGKDI